MSDPQISPAVPSGLSEDEYLDIVERIQKAMMIEPFRPNVADAVVLIGERQVLRREIARLRALLNHISEWDMLDVAADGPYWRSEIEKAVRST